MERNKLFIIAIVILVLLNISTLSYLFFSQHNHPPFGKAPHEGGPKKMIIERLRFSKDQENKFELLVQEHRNAVDSLNRISFELQNNYYDLLKHKSFNSSTLDSLSNQIGLNQEAIVFNNFKHFEKIKFICDDEQKNKFNALIDDILRDFNRPKPMK